MPEPLDPPVVGGFGASGLIRLRCDLGYDGTRFHGWARQPALRTVQQTLDEALQTALRLTTMPRTVCAGRTDAGVHARGQVVHVDVPSDSWTDDASLIVRRLNGLLDDDVRVFDVREAPAGFDARFSALRRHYRYHVVDTVGDPLLRNFVLSHPEALDVSRLNRASAPLIGEHDFAAFCREREGTSSVRRLDRFTWSRDDRGLVIADFTADAFCHSMVRSLVGALLPVGDGRRDEQWPERLLATERRDPAVTVAAPHGLVLMAVDYPADSDLAVQAKAARRWRGDPADDPMLGHRGS